MQTDWLIAQEKNLIDLINSRIKTGQITHYGAWSTRNVGASRSHSYLVKLRQQYQAEGKNFKEDRMYRWMESRVVIHQEVNLICYFPQNRKSSEPHMKVVDLINSVFTPRYLVAQSEAIDSIKTFGNREELQISKIVTGFDSIENAIATCILMQRS